MERGARDVRERPEVRHLPPRPGVEDVEAVPRARREPVRLRPARRHRDGDGGEGKLRHLRAAASGRGRRAPRVPRARGVIQRPRERQRAVRSQRDGGEPARVPDERREAAHIAEEIGPSAQSSDGKLNWAQLAGALYHAKLFVGVDTAAMHLAAACQCPTVAIFGPSRSWAWAPWRTQYKIIGPSDQQWADAAEGDIDAFLKTIIQSMPVSHVFDACEELLAPSPTQFLVNPENSN